MAERERINGKDAGGRERSILMQGVCVCVCVRGEDMAEWRWVSAVRVAVTLPASWVHLPAVRRVDCAVADVSNSSRSVIVYDTEDAESVFRDTCNEISYCGLLWKREEDRKQECKWVIDGFMLQISCLTTACVLMKSWLEPGLSTHNPHKPL